LVFSRFSLPFCRRQGFHPFPASFFSSRAVASGDQSLAQVVFHAPLPSVWSSWPFVPFFVALPLPLRGPLSSTFLPFPFPSWAKESISLARSLSFVVHRFISEPSRCSSPPRNRDDKLFTRPRLPFARANAVGCFLVCTVCFYPLVGVTGIPDCPAYWEFSGPWISSHRFSFLDVPQLRISVKGPSDVGFSSPLHFLPVSSVF